MSLPTTVEQQVFQSVKRACYAGLDSLTLRIEIAQRIGRVVSSDAQNFSTMDPDTGLINHAIGTDFSEQLAHAFFGHHYPDDEATSGIDQAREGRVVELGSSGALRSALEAEGIEHELRALFFDTEALWGSWCMMRDRGSVAFSDREIRFMERIAPHVAEGLKHAAFLEFSMEAEDDTAEEHGIGPAVLILDARANVTLRTPSAVACLDDLGHERAMVDGRLPFAVLSVRGRLLRQKSVSDAASADVRLRARGRSGTWYVLRATLTEPDATGASSAVVYIEPIARRDVAPLLFRLYNLSPREREVIVWVVRGETTKEIASHLGLSAHTVQDYLDNACEKIGVRGRKALVAKLFRDGYAPFSAA